MTKSDEADNFDGRERDMNINKQAGSIDKEQKLLRRFPGHGMICISRLYMLN